MNKLFENALQVVAAKVVDASFESVRRYIKENRGNMDEPALVCKLLRFDGSTVADLGQHLWLRNVLQFDFDPPRRTRSRQTLDELERQGGWPYANMGSRHG